MKQLTGKRILLGVTGGIAAYKSAELVRRLREAGATVRVVMTRAAMAFVTPLTFQALSGNPVHSELLDPEAEAGMGHIELARWADVVLIAPATADCIAKLAHGLGDDLLSTLCLVTRAPLALAPAMNAAMWSHAATQHNIALLQQRGAVIWGPAAGSQACGEIGWGRMWEPEVLLQALGKLWKSTALTGVSILVTAGPTRERLDPVRYLSNDSSGKMGYALAEAARDAGARVTLVSGPVSLPAPSGIDVRQVVSAQEMYDETLNHVEDCAIFIAAAAVADYRCQTIESSKIKKSAAPLQLALIPNPDIVASVGRLSPKPFVVGFAAETSDLLTHAKTKLQAKQMDMIVANQVAIAGQGFDSDSNAATVLWANGQQVFPLAQKSQLARELIHLIGKQYEQAKTGST